MAEGGDRPTTDAGSVDDSRGIEAFAGSDAVERAFIAPEHHESNDHVALLYDDPSRQFDTVAAFLAQGLERNERCLYVAHDNDPADVLGALRDRGVAVDAALDSGALTVETAADTYFEGGAFDPEDMCDFLAETVQDATPAYDGVRSTAEMTWALDAAGDLAALLTYERDLNRLYPDLDIVGLCQYDVDRFPEGVLRDVVRTHPHLVHDDVLAHNVYFSPTSAVPGDVERWTSVLAALASAETDLRRQNQRLEEFAGVVSHDLRNPLTVARGELELAREDVSSDHLATVDAALERMDRLVADLLALARQETDDVHAEWVSVARLAEACWDAIDAADARFRVETDARVRADERRLRQVLANLLGNAVEHGDGVTVTVGALSDGFYVADDGPGIPPDERADVFEAGYSTRPGGTGYGLNIVERIADTHGWDVAVTGGPDGGTRVELTGVELRDERGGRSP